MRLDPLSYVGYHDFTTWYSEILDKEAEQPSPVINEEDYKPKTDLELAQAEEYQTYE